MQKDGMQEKIIKATQLLEIAQSIDLSLPQLALAWCLKNPNVSTVITGASKISQLSENLKALDAVPKMDEGIINSIEAIVNNKPKPEPDFRML